MICVSMVHAQVLHEVHDRIHSAPIPQVLQRRQTLVVANEQCSRVGNKAGHDYILGSKSIVSSEGMKGCEAMVIVGLAEGCSAAILNELLNHWGIDMRIGTKSDEG